MGDIDPAVRRGDAERGLWTGPSWRRDVWWTRYRALRRPSSNAQVDRDHRHGSGHGRWPSGPHAAARPRDALGWASSAACRAPRRTEPQATGHL